LICGGRRERFFAPFAEICGNIAESPFAPLPTFLSGERKGLERSFGPLERSAFSAPRAFRRGDAFRKAADGFRRIAERFVRDNASLCSRRYRAGANGVRDAALRRPHGGGGSPPRRLPPCTRALRRGCVKRLQDGFRHIGERFVRSGGRRQRSRRYRAGANGVRDAALRRPTFAERIAASAAAAVHPRFKARAREALAGRLSADRRKDGGRL